MSAHQMNMQFGELIVDLFAGGGGACTGIKMATGRSADIAINHDGAALAVHQAANPDTVHYQEDVWDRHPSTVTRGRPVSLLWFSPDCRHHSRAKGGPIKSDRVRSLAWVGVRWARAVRPRMLVMENVEEMRSWGKLRADGTADPDHAGETWDVFVSTLKDLGYRVDHQLVSAHHHGAPTTRRRLFLIARRDDGALAWPEATHGPALKPYRSAAECIDWSIPTPSIFNRPRPLADNTMRRVATGVQRFVIDSEEPFIAPDGAAHCLVQTGYGERPGQAPRVLDIQAPLGTVVACGQKHALVTAWLAKHYTGVVGHTLTRPLGTITTVDHHSLVTALLVKYYATGIAHPVTTPLDTISTVDRFGLVTVGIEQYRIVDIGLRMLQPRELFNAQGFPPDYPIDVLVNGKPITKRDQVRLVGNSVSPPAAAAVVAANWVQQSEVAAA